MSFTIEVLEEISREIVDDSECLLSEFAGFSIVGGFLRFSSQGPEFVVRATRPVSIRRIIKVARTLFDFEIGPIIYSESAIEKWYEVSFRDSKLIEKLSSAGFSSEGLFFSFKPFFEKVKKNQKCLNSFLRGLFFAGGYLQSPKKGRDLEIQLQNNTLLTEVEGVLKKAGFRPGKRQRKHRYYLYIRNYEDIKDFLRRIGAVQASLKFEEEQVYRDMRNMVNRQVNFEKANVSRTVNSSLRQIEAVITIDKHIGINNLSPALREAAELRLKYPDASLSELVKISGGKITKSGLSNRFKRLEALSTKITKLGQKEVGKDA